MSPSSRRVLLLGDSVCMSAGYSFGSSGYAPLLAPRLAGDRIEVAWNTDNGGSSRTLRALVAGRSVDMASGLLLFNCGLHDVVRREPGAPCAVGTEEYAENLAAIARRLLDAGRGTVVWASTTPVIDELHLRAKGFVRRDADVREYNRLAATVAASLGIEVLDLCGVVERGGTATMLGPDGCHPNAAGRAALAEAVERLIRRVYG